MSYEKKIKNLMARLVSMSPQPPPYPEEMPMARHETRRKPRPALVFVGAAALVAVLAVPLFLFTGGEDPDVIATTTTSTVATSTTTTTLPEATTTTEPATTTTRAPVITAWTGVVFLYQQPENSFLDNPALVPVPIEVLDPTGELSMDDQFTEALAAIGPDLPDSLSNAIPAEVMVMSRRVEDQTVIADMNEAFLGGAGGLLADFTMLNQLIYTLTYDSGVDVLFTVDGESVEVFGSEGLELTSPVSRETFRDDNLNLIFLTQPLIRSGGVYVVAGMSNTFEATVDIAVLDGQGAVVHEDFTTATCGTGCWGEFSTEIDADLIVPGESSIRVFTYSAEDGSVSNAITVPIPEGDIWELTPGN